MKSSIRLDLQEYFLEFRTLLLALILSCSWLNISLVLAGTEAAPSKSNPPKKIQLALNWKPEPQFGGFYAAQFNGDFLKEGLSVEIIEGGSGTPTAQLLANEKVDFAIVSAEEILLSQDKNKDHPILGVFAVYQTNPQALMVHEERGFKSIEEVFSSEGVLSLQSGLSYVQYLKKKFPRIKPQIVPYQGGIAPFLKDAKFSQQCFATSEPLLAAKSGAKVKTFLISEAGFNPYTTVVAVRKEYLEKNNDIAKKMVRAIRAGWTSYLINPSQTNKEMAKMNKSMDDETFAKSAEVQKPLILSPPTGKMGAKVERSSTGSHKNNLGDMTEARWDELVNEMYELKLISNKIKSVDLFRNL